MLRVSISFIGNRKREKKKGRKKRKEEDNILHPPTFGEYRLLTSDPAANVEDRLHPSSSHTTITGKVHGTSASFSFIRLDCIFFFPNFACGPGVEPVYSSYRTSRFYERTCLLRRNNRYRAHFATPTTTARVSFLPGFHSSKRTPITAEKGSTMIFAKKIASKFTHQRT